MEHASFYAESSVIGSVLIDPRALAPARRHCQAADFQNHACHALFRAACVLADRSRTVDPVSILQETRRQGTDLEEQQMLAFMDATPSAANVESYAEAVHEGAVRRQLSSLGQSLQDQALDETRSVPELLACVSASVNAVSFGTTHHALSSSEAAEEILEHRGKLEEGTLTPLLSTGYKNLDRLLGGGFLEAGLYVLAARPGVGKSTLGLQIADHASRHRTVLFVSLEMPSVQLTARRIAVRSKVPLGMILFGASPTERQQQAIAEASSDIAQTRLQLYVAPGCSVSDIALEARGLDDLGLIVVDYLGLLAHPEKGRSIYEGVTANSKALKQLALSLNIPILCLCQLNRECESRTDKRPQASDLRDSGAIEQDADGILLLCPHPAERTPQNPAEPDHLEVIVDKNRNGPLGHIYLNFYPKIGLICE